MDDDTDDDTSELWLLRLDWPLERSVLKEELLEEAVLIARIVLPLEELSEISEDTPELAEDEAELKIVVMDAMVFDVSLIELAVELGVIEPEVEFANTIDELASVLDTAVIKASTDVEFDVLVPEFETVELKLVVEETSADVDDVDEEDVKVRSVERLEEVADDDVGLDGADIVLEPVLKLARRLDAEADDELGAAVDTPKLSSLIMSAAYVQQVSWEKSQHPPLSDSAPHTLEDEDLPLRLAQVEA
ncbi:MAG: hypothetical protein Q9198_008291 [Flavoplaca austrocitrina]